MARKSARGKASKKDDAEGKESEDGVARDERKEWREGLQMI